MNPLTYFVKVFLSQIVHRLNSGHLKVIVDLFYFAKLNRIVIGCVNFLEGLVHEGSILVTESLQVSLWLFLEGDGEVQQGVVVFLQMHIDASADLVPVRVLGILVEDIVNLYQCFFEVFLFNALESQ